MINKDLTETLGFAVKEAKRRRHEYVCVEHVLFAILHDGFGRQVIENCGGSVDNLIDAIERFFKNKIEIMPDESDYVLQQTIGFQRIIQKAVSHARSAEKKKVMYPMFWFPFLMRKIRMQHIF